jgi:hypothetical protein
LLFQQIQGGPQISFEKHLLASPNLLEILLSVALKPMEEFWCVGPGINSEVQETG